MVDTSTVDLLTLVESDVKLTRKGSTGGGEYAGACPFCGGQDRFIIWPTPSDGKPRYWCRGCGASGDAISYVMQRDGVDFKTAINRLGLTVDPISPVRRHKSRTPAPRREKEYWAAFDQAWQAGAERFCGEAADTLHSADGAPGREYLASRGIKMSTAAAKGLGWNPTAYHADWGSIRVYLPPGLVLPWWYLDTYWSINVRCLEGRGPKYKRPRGAANGLYVAGAFYPGVTAIMVEGEIDALTVWQEATAHGLPVVAVATGSAQGSRLYQWVALLASARRQVLAFDGDAAGSAAADWWGNLFPDAIRLVPESHDVNQMHQDGHDVRAWIANCI